MSRLYIVGSGPGQADYLTQAAVHAIEQSSDLVAYRLYLDLLGPLVVGKVWHPSPIGQEVMRGRLALDLAVQGKVVSLISSGDAGIYAMASVIFELIDKADNQTYQTIDIEVVPGISALQTLSSRVGAPLGQDFCTISLSDLLTPWSVIESRIHGAGAGDFVITFYNPVSKQRDWQLAKAREILLQYRAADVPVILGKNLTRDNESVQISTLAEFDVETVDMFTVVMVGNATTRQLGSWVYTPRGYDVKKLFG